jgi:serine/threonine protein kinase
MIQLPKIPGYELLRCLGGGPITRVFAARECESGTPCAVKLLRDECRDQPAAIKFLQREARCGLAVSHPHLVHIMYAHVLRSPHFLVMEMLPGESVRRRLQRVFRLALTDTLWIARQTAEAIAALHQAGFIHGDVKPDNIYLVEDGTSKLVDLGFAHRPGENASLVRRGYVIGTADYMAPEVCAKDPAADTSTDLFSFGVTLYEMLSGRLPYPSGTAGDVIKRHRSDPPAGIRQYAAGLPGTLANLVERLLSHRPAERPRAAKAVQQLISLEIASLGQRRSA